jgi:hypothetical protein
MRGRRHGGLFDFGLTGASSFSGCADGAACECNNSVHHGMPDVDSVDGDLGPHAGGELESVTRRVPGITGFILRHHSLMDETGLWIDYDHAGSGIKKLIRYVVLVVLDGLHKSPEPCRAFKHLFGGKISRVRSRGRTRIGETLRRHDVANIKQPFRRAPLRGWCNQLCPEL